MRTRRFSFKPNHSVILSNLFHFFIHISMQSFPHYSHLLNSSQFQWTWINCWWCDLHLLQVGARWLLLRRLFGKKNNDDDVTTNGDSAIGCDAVWECSFQCMVKYVFRQPEWLNSWWNDDEISRRLLRFSCFLWCTFLNKSEIHSCWLIKKGKQAVIQVPVFKHYIYNIHNYYQKGYQTCFFLGLDWLAIKIAVQSLLGMLKLLNIIRPSTYPILHAHILIFRSLSIVSPTLLKSKLK